MRPPLPLHRAYNSGPASGGRLLHLQHDVLGIIARKMGKRARLLCSQVCHAYGPPGALLRLDSAIHTASYQSIIQSYRYPHAVRRLTLGHGVELDGPAWLLIAEALPNLLELTCDRIDTMLHEFRTTTHTSLTSLRAARMIANVDAVAALAQNLRSLHVAASLQFWPANQMWGALALIRGLQHLEVPVSTARLSPADSFCAAMEALTGLTHLGLHHDTSQDRGAAALPDATQPFTEALHGLPLLSSLKLQGLRWLGPPLGAALQALTLTSLHLERAAGENQAHLPFTDLAGRLPDISAMPLLLHLGLAGSNIFRAFSLQLGGGGSRSLRSLALTHVLATSQLGMLRDTLQGLTGLTSLSLGVSGSLHFQAMPFVATSQLAGALSQLPRLQHLEIRGNLYGLLPCLAGLTALTSLEVFLVIPLDLQLWAELQVVSTLSSLRKLSLKSHSFHPCVQTQCMRAVRSMPLLEEVQLLYGVWTEEAAAVLVPPPEALLRVVLGAKASATAACASLDAANRLRSYGVDVVVKLYEV
jgi:hypothetical protein